MNDAEPYIAAVADACQKAGLFVRDYWSDDIDPRDGAVQLTLDPDRDPDADPDDEFGDWQLSRTLGWDEEKGWFLGEPKDHHGELTNLLWIGTGALPDPADVAEQAWRIIAGEMSADERRSLIGFTRWRDQEDNDGFEEELAAYRQAATPETGGE